MGCCWSKDREDTAGEFGKPIIAAKASKDADSKASTLVQLNIAKFLFCN